MDNKLKLWFGITPEMTEEQIKEFLEDIKIVCRALLQVSTSYLDSDYDNYTWCHLCGERTEKYDHCPENITHKPNCQILLAQKILYREH